MIRPCAHRPSRSIAIAAVLWTFLAPTAPTFALRAPAALPFALLARAAPPFAQESEDPAVVAYRTGRYEEAINAFRVRTRAAEAVEGDYRYLVRVLSEVGRYEQAEEVARNFIAEQASSSELHNSLGEVLWATGRLDEAEAMFRQSVAGGATDRLTAELNLGIAAFDRGRRDEAMQRFDRFIDVYNGGGATTSAELTAVGVACQYLGILDKELFKDALKAFDEAVTADPNDLSPRILTGKLFLDRYDSGGAATELSAVLQRNPQHPEALLATARRMQFDNEAGALAMVESALQTNPNMVAAHAFRARTLLTAERFDEAVEALQPALEVNPSSLESLAVLATAHYLEGDSTAFERARDRALLLNPGYAELYNTLADLAVQNRLYAQAVDFAREATRVDPQSWRGYSILGLNLLRVGDIAGGRESLEISFAGDPYNVWVLNTLDLLDTFPGYVESSTERFDLMIEEPESRLLSLYVGLLAEEAYDYFEQRYGYSPPLPIRIEVYPSHYDFSVRTVGLTGLGALGVSFGPVIAIDSPSARPLGEFNWGTTLWHEIGHTFTLGTTDFRIPRWLSEGLSVYEERRARPSWGDDARASFLFAHLRGALLPVSRITDGFVRPAYPEQVVHSYYQASLVCELIERDWGFDAILGLLDAYKNGLSTGEAFEQALGVDLVSFDASFNDYLEETFAGPLAALRPALEDGIEGHATGEEVSAAALRDRVEDNPEDFFARLTYGVALYGQEDYERAAEQFEAAKRLFPSYVEVDTPYWYLAMMAKQRGDLRRAVDELEALATVNEMHFAANVELANLHEELGEPERAAAALERTIYIYPLEIPMHQKLAELYADVGNHELAIRERQAVVALRPVDMAEALYQLALAEFNGGDLAAARRSVIGSLEIAPGYPAAQELLLSIVGGAKEDW